MKDGYFPLTAAQYNIWLNEQVYSGSAINVIHGSLWLNEQVDPALLQEAVDILMDRSDIFRLRFAVDDGETVQYLDSSRLGKCNIGAACTYPGVKELLNDRAVTPFSFEHGRLYDLCIYPLDNGFAVLSIRIHHILLDGFGMRLLCDQILTAYGALRDGKTVLIPESHFIENVVQAEDTTEVSRSFWKNYLSSLAAQPVLSQEKAGSMSRFLLQAKVDEQLCRDIRRFCDENPVTPYTVFAAALGVFIGRLGQADDAVIVLPRLNRSSEQALKTPGVYTLAVPLRIKPSETMTFQELCLEVLTKGQEISLHKEYGYSRIMSDLKAAGELEGNLSQFTLNFQKGTLTTTMPARLDFSACGAMSNHITLNVSDEQGDGLYQIDYDYRSDLYTEQRIEFFHGSLMQIISDGLNGKRLGEISIITPQETTYLSTISHGKTIPYERQETIVSLFKKAAAEYLDRSAIIGLDNHFTFGELDVLSDQLASGLLKNGIGREQLVAFMLPRTTQILVCILGILKAGAAFLPVDPQYPSGRIDYMLDNSEAVLLISDSALPAAQGRNFATVPDLLANNNSIPLPQDITPAQTAYCIYTSGTTGQPKGVLLEHRGIVNITQPENNPFNQDICQHGRGIVAIGSICFDISLFEIFVPLLNGMFVVMAPEDAMADPVAIAKLLTDNNANILHCTPSRLSAYLTEASFIAALGGVDVILSAGEVLPAALINTLNDDYDVRIYNGYGPTETTIGATITEAGDNLSIGRPIANTFIRIVDLKGRDLPVGAAGEILVGGDGVGRGYLNMPELNSEKFILIEGERFYRTGDIGYLKDDCRIMYMGRNDHQVKLRGLRIELSEIENCIRQYDGITICAVTVREISGHQHLVAFYSAGSDIAAAELKEYLALYLPPYMVPDVLVCMEQLPITINGKIDLHELMEYPITIERPYREPSTPEEAILCRIFSSVLQLERIGADDNFFEMGGTSLLAAKVMLQARSDNIILSYGDVFKNPTPKMLAAVGKKIETSEAENTLAEFDYSMLRPVLARNQTAELLPSHKLGNVLLTGATGYLGIHILKELIDHPESVGNIYCLIRPKEKLDSEKRMKSTLFYYFEEIDKHLCDNRLFAVEGDVTKENLCTVPLDVPIDTVIHSAANVSHFAYGDILQKVNTEGLKNVIHFAQQHGSAVVHISTLSVGGYAAEQQIKAGMLLDETSLYVGQKITNAYILSKYLAEHLLLQAAANGLSVKIMRVGNLQGRLLDGEFQMNLRSNAFARMLKSYALLKRAPFRLKTAGVNFSPVDDTAKSIYLLAGSNDRYTIFHTFNPTTVQYSDIFEAMKEAGYQVDWMPDLEFEKMVEKLAQEEENQPIVEGILLEQPDIHLREVPCTGNLTASVLSGYGFTWGEITRDYLGKYFEVLDGLGLFDV